MFSGLTNWIRDFFDALWLWAVDGIYAVAESVITWGFAKLPTEWADLVSGRNPLNGNEWWVPVSSSFYLFNSVYPLKETFLIFGAAISVVGAVRMVKLTMKVIPFVWR